jgi:hypothetical protein
MEVETVKVMKAPRTVQASARKASTGGAIRFPELLNCGTDQWHVDFGTGRTANSRLEPDAERGPACKGADSRYRLADEGAVDGLATALAYIRDPPNATRSLVGY